MTDVPADLPVDLPTPPPADLPGDLVATFDRQRQIWTNLYGPARAAALIDAAGARQAERPDLDVRYVFAALDPERDEDYVDFVATRW